MRKILAILFTTFFIFTSSYANEDLKIISRSQWGANESYRYVDSPEWQSIIKKADEAVYVELSEEQKEVARKRAEKTKKMNEILVKDYYDDVKVVDTIYTENGHSLRWPIQKTKSINSIVIHHTYSEYDDSYSGVRSIYKFHTLTRQWGDIGYNFLIGKDGEIFEGRAGGANTVAAHDKWNNRSTIGIALIGNYSVNKVNEKQLKSLQSLTKFLVNKYSIDLNSQESYHKECMGDGCELPLNSFKLDSIIGHRDAGTTTCPGDALYAQIEGIKAELRYGSQLAKINKLKLFKKLDKISELNLLILLEKIEKHLEKNTSNISEKIYLISSIKNHIIEYVKNKELTNSQEGNNETLNIANQLIKVKLSYPSNNKIELTNSDETYNITREGNYLIINGKKEKVFNLKSKKGGYVEILSWNRIPSWDRNMKYNDNKFRGDIILYVKNKQLHVVNRLPMNDYLKGLGEVSNGDNSEKIKTIITSARTYALWYVLKARKFPGEWYDASDDPNVFQKYLGYSLELRSPNVNTLVDETKNKIITYDGKLIKPWYFSQSDGKTLGFEEYCLKNNVTEVCDELKKQYPYLQSVSDNASKGKTRLGHGVGISGLGSSYFASKGWTSEMIIKYYLRGVEVGYQGNEM
ncbi:hypothetical protein A9Q91_03960 [Candidatus Gracilibacteria bacterium 28_42_T64]|nr:hypothetical protein A9Q91_03960 [Candidatus Gracilibacteria bacterium 28_42_T64]